GGAPAHGRGVERQCGTDRAGRPGCAAGGDHLRRGTARSAAPGAPGAALADGDGAVAVPEPVAGAAARASTGPTPAGTASAGAGGKREIGREPSTAAPTRPVSRRSLPGSVRPSWDSAP